MSAPIMAVTMTMHIGIETSQNNRHPLMALFCSIAFRSILIIFNRLHRDTGRIPVIFSFRKRTVTPADRSRRHFDRAW
jgi:hypothetical protein